MDDLSTWLLERIAEDKDVASLELQRVEDGYYEYQRLGPGWLPARVLAECEAKRRIIAVHTGAHECASEDDNCVWVGGEEACITLRLMTLPFTDRTGCRQEWKP